MSYTYKTSGTCSSKIELELDGDVEVGGYVATLGGAFLGAAAVMALLIVFSSIVKSNTMLLIIGMLVSYLGSSVVQLLNSIASEESIHSYVTWGFGTFSGVTTAQLPLYVALIAFGLLCSVLMVKPLNALLLGTRYAENLGVNTRHTRMALLMVMWNVPARSRFSSRSTSIFST